MSKTVKKTSKARGKTRVAHSKAKSDAAPVRKAPQKRVFPRKSLKARALAPSRCRAKQSLDKAERVEMCREWKKRVGGCFLFTDEKWGNVGDHGRSTEWRRINDPPSRRENEGNYGKKIHVWGAIGIGFRRLVFYDEDVSVTADVYVTSCLAPIVGQLRKKGTVLIHDGARVHTAKATTDWLSRHKVCAPRWMPHSPGLNPIEHMWSIVQERVDARVPVNKEQLVQFWKEEWAAVPQSTIDALVGSFMKRLDMCIAAKGEVIY